MYKNFEEMPSHARVWVYQADRKLSSSEQQWISERLEYFCRQWNTHGTLMPTSYQLKFDQVILLAVDESNLGASGCSIDSSVRTLKEIEQHLNINLLDQGKVSYLTSDQKLQVSPLQGIKTKVAEGTIHPETPVLNPAITKKMDLESKWIISAKESWLNKYFDN